jgi:hypothetical protein
LSRRNRLKKFFLCVFEASCENKKITSPAPAGVPAGRGRVVRECQRTTADGGVGESVSFLLMGWKLGCFRLDGKSESEWIRMVFVLTEKYVFQRADFNENFTYFAIK